jgi:hypothetical protein
MCLCRAGWAKSPLNCRLRSLPSSNWRTTHFGLFYGIGDDGGRIRGTMRPSSGRPYPVVAFGRQYEPAQGSAGRRLQPPTAKVRMSSTVMTPGAMLVRGHIRIRCCTLWRRRLLVSRLGHRRILRHRNGRQCADNQGAAYKSDIHARLRVLRQSAKVAIAFVVKMIRTPCPGPGQRQVQ